MATVQELMALRAPDSSGVDPKALVQALSAAGQAGTPQTYAYGMRPDEVARETTATAQMQQQRYAQVMEAAKMAMDRDTQLFSNAMKAHDAYIQERNTALRSASLDLERRALEAKEKMLPHQLEAAKREAEMLGLKAEAMKNLDSLEVDIPNPDAGKPAVGPDGNPLLDEAGQPVLQGATRRIPALTGQVMGLDVNTLMGLKPKKTAQEQKFEQALNMYKQMGFDEQDSFMLSQFNMGKVGEALNKNVETALKNAQDPLNLEGYGQVQEGVDKKGRPIMRQRTPEEFGQDVLRRQISSMFSMISKPGQDRLLQSLSSLSALTPLGTSSDSSVGSSDLSIDPTSSVNMDEFIQSLLTALQ